MPPVDLYATTTLISEPPGGLQMVILQLAHKAAVQQAGEAAEEAAGLRASAQQHAWAQRLLNTLLSEQLQQNQIRAAQMQSMLQKQAGPVGMSLHNTGVVHADSDYSDDHELSASDFATP